MIELSPSFAVWGGSLLLAKGNQGAFSERNRILPLFCVGGEASACGGGFCEGKPRPLLRVRQNSPPLLQCGGGGFCSRGEETKVPSQGTKAKARENTTINLYFQGSSCQPQQFQHSLTAAIWTLIWQQLPATTLKMRLLSLLLSAHRLLLMTMMFKLCPPPLPPPRPVITRSARRATIVMTNKANRRSNGSSLPPPRSDRSHHLPKM